MNMDVESKEVLADSIAFVLAMAALVVAAHLSDFNDGVSLGEGLMVFPAAIAFLLSGFFLGVRKI